jgi:3-hydroxyacyl-CoA dehydrogenase/enoyl-CoA hydratase/3-hydroxybutyryl-CoA epimerase
MSAFRIDISSGVAVITFDLPGSPVNMISTLVATEFGAVLDEAERNPSVRAMVLISGKRDSFVAGADIEEFGRLTSQAEAEAMSRQAQAMMDRVEGLLKPIVAAIHGACLGGGYELALACDWRVATDHDKTQIGLPEVQLGVIPGAGGTQRLPRLIGVRAALDLILAGRSERASKALRLGMVDEVVPPSILRVTAIRAAQRLADRGASERRSGGGIAGALLDRTPIGRRLVYSRARQTALKKTGGHYPAPLAALDVVQAGLEHGMPSGLREEHRRFGELAVGDVSRKLVQIFFATTALKKDDGVEGGVPASPTRRLGVIGAGFMGAAIAGTAALNARVEVRLKDAELERVGRGIKAALKVLDDRLKRRRLSKPEHARLSQLVSGSADWSGFRRADLIIEAVFEDLDVKRAVLADVERETSGHTVFASNTSTIPIAELAAQASRPEQVIGMHFFSPVEKMPLLEVIPHAGTSDESVVRAVRFGRRMGKTVIVVRDSPGFWVNRILLPYMNEAGVLLAEGVPVDLIDGVITRYGFPVGPVTLLDEVGLDVASKAGAVMHQHFGARLEPAPVLQRMLEDGRQGRKNGRGFYRYEDGEKKGVDETVYKALGVQPLDDAAPTMVEQRLVYAMLNEAAMAAGEGVVRSARDGDIGAVFGIGFPPFRGGPLRQIDDLGAARVVEVLLGLEIAHGERFRPATHLVEMAERGEAFY